MNIKGWKTQDQLLAVFTTLIFLGSCTPVHTQTLSQTEILAAPTLSITPSQNHEVFTTDKNILLDFAVSPGGNEVAVYTNQEVSIYDLTTGLKKTIRRFDTYDLASMLYAGALSYSSDGKTLAVSGKFPGESIDFWSMVENEWIGSMFQEDEYDDYSVTELAFGINENRLIVRNHRRAVACEGPQDMLVLYGIEPWDKSEEIRPTEVFKMDGCSIVSPDFRFTAKDEVFLRFRGTSSLNTILFVDGVTGNVDFRKEVDAQKESLIYDVSDDGSIIAVRESSGQTTVKNRDSARIIEIFARDVVLLKDKSVFLLRGENIDEWILWDEDGQRCEYHNVVMFQFKASLNKAVFGVYNPSEEELQLWSTKDCSLIEKFHFD